MSDQFITLDRLADPAKVEELVGGRRSRRWARPNQLLRRSDGVSIWGFFEAHGQAEREEIVRQRILGAIHWAPLLRTHIPKLGSLERRPIDMATVSDTARLYLIHDRLSPLAETVLTRVAIAFRPGRSLTSTALEVRQQMGNLPYASVIDIKAFFDSISWQLLDAVLSALPADEAVRELLRDLIRVPVIDRRRNVVVPRSAGIPQGLSISPILANLVLADFDRAVTSVLGKVKARLWRYCDDILVLAPNLAALEHSLIVIRQRLGQLGLKVKKGTGAAYDARDTPVSWLGLSFTPTEIDVPAGVIKRKTDELQARVDLGVVSPEGIEEALRSRQNHYRRIIGSERADKVIATMRGGLHVRAHQERRRKEGVERLRELVTER